MDVKKFKKLMDTKLSEEGIDYTMASVDKVEKLEIFIDMVLEALGHSEAIVTDESELCDFLDIFYEPEETEASLDDLRERFGIKINDEYEKIVDLAERIKEKQEQEDEP